MASGVPLYPLILSRISLNLEPGSWPANPGAPCLLSPPSHFTGSQAHAGTNLGSEDLNSVLPAYTASILTESSPSPTFLEF